MRTCKLALACLLLIGCSRQGAEKGDGTEEGGATKTVTGAVRVFSPDADTFDAMTEKKNPKREGYVIVVDVGGGREVYCYFAGRPKETDLDGARVTVRGKPAPDLAPDTGKMEDCVLVEVDR